MADRRLLSGIVAVALALIGVVVTVVRPTAPALSAATDLAGFGPDVLAAVEAYRGPRRVAAAGIITITVLVPILAVVTRSGRRWIGRIGGGAHRAPVRAGLIATALIVSIDLATLPARYLGGYVLDGRFGFRTAGLDTWVRDLLIASAGGWMLAFLAGAVFALALERWPRSWHLRLAVLATGITAALVLLAPLVLEPLLLPTSPMPEGETRSAVESVMARGGDPDAPLLVGEASRRTTKVNAYVTGLGPTRRVVVYDTLLELPPEQVASVVAHELAHRIHRDIERGVALSATGFLALTFIVRGVLRAAWTQRRLRLRGDSDPRSVAVAAAVGAVCWLVVMPVVSHVSRTAEAAADHAALELTMDPATQIALQRGFVLRDLSDPSPPSWYRLLLATHPSPAERIRAAAGFAEQTDLDLPSVEELRAQERSVRHPVLR